MSHEDKFDHALKPGETVQLYYGGDRHTAQVTELTRKDDVDHVTLRILTPVTVPAASVAFQASKPRENQSTKSDPPLPDPPQDPALPPTPRRTAHRTATKKDANS